MRDIAVPAPRGEILDRDGNVLVDSQAVDRGADLAARPARASRRASAAGCTRRLRSVLGISDQAPELHDRRRPARASTPGSRRSRARSPSSSRCCPTRTSRSRPTSQTTSTYYLAERQDQFPGVNVEQVWLRQLPAARLAAQLFGTVGPISPAGAQARRATAASSQNAIVGQSGLEWYYNRYLRGTTAPTASRSTPLGQLQGLPVRAPADRRAQAQAVARPRPPEGRPAGARAGDRAPTRRHRRARSSRSNPANGEVYAMGSLPDVRPEHLHQAV